MLVSFPASTLHAGIPGAQLHSRLHPRTWGEDVYGGSQMLDPTPGSPEPSNLCRLEWNPERLQSPKPQTLTVEAL